MSAIQEVVTEAPAVEAVPKRAMTLGYGTSLAMLALLIVAPLFVKNFIIFQLTMLLIYGLAVLALNILTGGSGQFSLGQSAFYAVGAYTSAILMEHADINYALTLPVAGVICFAFGFLFGQPALRLSGIYLALATFALATAMPQLLKLGVFEYWTGGVQGLVVTKPDAPFGLPMSQDMWLYYFTLAVSIAIYIFSVNLLKSRSGRAFMAIRDNEIAASAMGIDVALYKTLAFGVSAGITGVAGGLGANPHPAQALEEFTSREDLLPTIEAALRTFDHYGNRDNKLRARMKWLVDTMGIDELRERILKERRLLRAASGWPGGLPEQVVEHGDAPAGLASDGVVAGVPGTSPVRLLATEPYQRWLEANVVRGRANGTISAYASCTLGDITADQFRALAAIQRDFGLDVRITSRQNLVLRDLTEADLRGLFDRLAEIGMAQPGAELSRDVVACPGADTCNLAVTQSRGLASDIGRALDEAGLSDVGGVKVNISGCTNSCGQHHISDIGFFGLERRAHGRSAPGYQMLLGGKVGDMEIVFGEKATKLPAKAASEAVVRVVGRFAGERNAGENFGDWLSRSGGAAGVGTALAELDEFPDPLTNPDYYIDFDETGPYVADVGDGECMT